MFGLGVLRRLILAAAAGFVASQGAAQTATSPVVVELFTSQACSSCPPADELLNELASRSDVIALGLHVDYWDYLGWRDIFASPANARRQRAYAEAGSARIVFTPQMVVDGAVSVVGSQRADVLDEVALAATQAKPARVVVQRDGAWLDIAVDVAAGIDQPTPVEVTLFVFDPPALVKPTRGENAGRRIVYRNPVRDWHVLGEWRGAPVRWRAPAPQDAAGVAVVAQKPGGQVLGAAQLILRDDGSRMSQSGARNEASALSAPAAQRSDQPAFSK